MSLDFRPKKVSLSVTFDITTVVSSATNAGTTRYRSNVRVSDNLSNAVTVGVDSG